MSDRMQLTGTVVHKRKKGDQLWLTVKVVSHDATTESLTEHIVVQFSKDNFSQELLRLLLLGTELMCTGQAAESVVSSQGKMGSMTCTNVKIERASAGAGLQGIERLVAACKSGIMSREECRHALECSSDCMEDLCNSSGESLKQKVIRISRRLKNLPEARHRTRPPRVSNAERALLAHVKSSINPLFQIELEEYQLEAIPLPVDPIDTVAHDHDKDVEESDSKSDRKCSSVAQFGAYLDSKKVPQLQWMLETLAKLFALDEEGEKEKVVVDVGCGRGDLALNVAARFPSTRVIAIDVNAKSLRVGEVRAREKGLQNVCFWNCSVELLLGLFSSSTAANLKEEKDVWHEVSLEQVEMLRTSRVTLVGLHACGGLSDAIINLACKIDNASVLCVTCCFTKNVELRESLCKGDDDDGVDTWRWWGFDSSQGAKLAQLCELHESEEVFQSAMQCVNSIRLANAVQRFGSTRNHLLPRLLAFPRRFSPKNQVICLVDRLHSKDGGSTHFSTDQKEKFNFGEPNLKNKN